jgi:hypothetical protein
MFSKDPAETLFTFFRDKEIEQYNKVKYCVKSIPHILSLFIWPVHRQARCGHIKIFLASA